MANTKSAIKHIKTSERQRIRNRAVKTAARTYVKRARQAITQNARHPANRWSRLFGPWIGRLRRASFIRITRPGESPGWLSSSRRNQPHREPFRVGNRSRDEARLSRSEQPGQQRAAGGSLPRPRPS